MKPVSKRLPNDITACNSTHGDELLNWLQKPVNELHIAGSYTLLYNATLMVKEGLGYAISFDKLIKSHQSLTALLPCAILSLPPP